MYWTIVTATETKQNIQATCMIHDTYPWDRTDINCFKGREEAEIDTIRNGKDKQHFDTEEI